MKKFSKILITILTVVLAVNMLSVSAFAADTAAGKSGSVTFSYTAYGVDGTVSLSDPNGVIDSWSVSANPTGYVSGSSVMCWGPDLTAYKITVSYTVNDDATIGDEAVFTFDGNKCVDYNGTGAENNEAVVSTKTVTVVKSTTPGGSSGGNVGGNIIVRVNHTALKAQIAAANELVEADYTTESWATLADALKVANEAMDSKTQSVVDAATEQLKTAIAGLVKLDRTALTAALTSANTFLNGADAATAKAFVEAFITANDLMKSGASQAEIDAAVSALNAAAEALKAALNKAPEKEIVTSIVTSVVVSEKVVEKTVEVPGQTVTSIVEVPGATVTSIVEVEKVVEKTVEVPTEPTDPFCNQGAHDVWFALFLLFAGATTALVVLTAVNYTRRKNNHKDNTPLVNYNIEDDDK